MASKSKIKVHLADDHEIVVDAIRAVLSAQNDIEVVGFSLNGEEVLNWYKTNYADILVLDINMPVKDGVQVLRDMSSMQRKPGVIVLSSYDDVKLIKEVLKLGARGYIPKKMAGQFIGEAIHKVFDGEQYFTPDIKEKMMQSLLGQSIDEKIGQEGILASSLTARECEILKLIAQEKSTKQIADILFLSENTVDTHRRNLMTKIKVKNAVGLAMFAIKNNLS